MASSRLYLPFPIVGRTNALGRASLVLLYAAVYLKDLASGWVSSSMAILVLAVGLVLGFAPLLMRRSPPSRASIMVLTMLVVAWTLTLVGKGILNTSSYYLAIPCAFVVVNTNPRLFIKLLIAHLVATLTIEMFEYFSGHYFFIYHAQDGTELDESLFGGSLDVFRAKGMFQGPLSAVAFALWMAFLFRGSVPAASMLFFCAFFASGRLGMFTSLFLLVARFMNGGSKSVWRVLPWALGIAAAGWLLLSFSDDNRRFFILSALDIGNDQNVSRVEFWLLSLKYYLSYSPIDMLVGNYGFILRREGGTENDFLRLLLDCGLIGFFIYAGAIITLLVRALRLRDREDLLIALLIISLMNIFPFVQSLSSALLFWVYFFAKMNRRRRQASLPLGYRPRGAYV